MKFGDYSVDIAQVDDGIKEKLKFRNCPNSTINLLVDRFDMPDMRCFSIGGMKNLLDTILESFGKTEEIVISVICLSPTTNSTSSSSLLSS